MVRGQAAVNNNTLEPVLTPFGPRKRERENKGEVAQFRIVGQHAKYYE